jgi:hypothetical protein
MMQRNDDALSTRDLASPNETPASAASGRERDASSREGRPSSQAPVQDDQTGAPLQDDQTGAPVQDDHPGAPLPDDQTRVSVTDRSLDRSAGDDPVAAQELPSPEGPPTPSADTQLETAQPEAADPEAAIAAGPSSGGAPAPDAEVQADVTEPLLASEQSADFQLRWEQVQTRFVDEPRGAVEDADELVANLMQQLAEGFAQERERLEAQWGRGEDISTEDLRVALKRYRSFFQRLLST